MGAGFAARQCVGKRPKGVTSSAPRFHRTQAFLPTTVCPLARCLLSVLALGSETASAPTARAPHVQAEAAVGAPARLASAVRYFDLEGDPKKDLVQNTVADFGNSSVEARVVFGPASASSRPKGSFIAFEAPAELATKDIERAFRKIGLRA